MLKYRISSGLILGAGFLAAVFFASPVAALLLLLAVVIVAQVELFAMFSAAGIQGFRGLGVAAGCLMVVSAFASGVNPGGGEFSFLLDEHVVFVVCLASVFLVQMFGGKIENSVPAIACTLFGIWYVPYLLGFVARMFFVGASGLEVGNEGRLWVLYLVFVVKMGDIGAFFTGRKFGRHKLFPRVSPGKTWEGLAGGVAASVVASVALIGLAGRFMGYGGDSLWQAHAVSLGVCMAGVGVLGDMFESLLKRGCGIKDSSGLVPGMGGLLDVLDSLLFCAPLLYAYVQIGLPT